MMLEYFGSSSENRVVETYQRLRDTLRPFRHWIGIPLALVSLLYVGREVRDAWRILGPAIRDAHVPLLFAGLGAASLATLLAGWNWGSILKTQGVDEPWMDTLRAFFLANLTRYLPGGVWHFAGRVIWLSERGHRIETGMWALVVEQGATLITAAILGFALSGPVFWNAWGLSLLAVVMLILLTGLMTIATKTPGEGVIDLAQLGYQGLLVLRYSVFWVLYGLAPVCFLAALSKRGAMTLPISARVVGQSALAWAAGYIVLVVPGGWGIRESVLMHLLSGEFSRDVAILLPVMARVSQILAELVWGCAFLPIRANWAKNDG